MENDSFFFSLRWKLAILFGTVFLVLHSIFSYVAYLDKIDSFVLDRKNIQSSHIDVVNTLTEESFAVLEQFAELLPLIGDLPVQHKKIAQHSFKRLDENWSQWELSWDMESIVFFDKNKVRIKSWGIPQITPDTSVGDVLRNETPLHQIYCSDNCFLQVMIPVIGKSEVIGVFSVVRSFADVIIKYKNETNSDIGLLATDKNASLKSGNKLWNYKPSGLTLSEKNLPVYEYLSKKYPMKDLVEQSKTLYIGDEIFEVRITPIQSKPENNRPYFLLIDDITSEVKRLNLDLEHVWINGMISLAASLILLTLVIHISLRRVGRLAMALPLLSKNQYDRFKTEIVNKDSFYSGYDELDRLNHTALTLADQLEFLEREVRSNTLKLLEKSRELGDERDFIRQLIESAPIIIITQKLNGIILSINQAGLVGFEADIQSITGKVFDLFLPESDWEHLKKLNQLRSGILTDQIKVDGILVTETGRQRDISWLHKLFKTNSAKDEVVILTLGVDNSERKMYEQKILSMTTRDTLTGLNNRKKFQEALGASLASAQRYGYKVALFYLNLNQFKQVNNTSGHEAGDKLLALVANVLKDITRATDILSRVDGDEFTVIVSHIELKGIQSIAEKIIREFKNLAFTFAGKSFELSASMGVAIYPDHGLTVNELFANADIAMCQAKALGSGKYHFFSPDPEYKDKLDTMLYWRQTLEDAIACDRFILYYQPIQHIGSNTISHYECLLRLQQKDGMLIMPGDFIEHAEEIGLMGKIDRLVLKKAMQKLIEFQSLGKDYKLAINLSGRLFNDSTIVEDISRMLDMPDIDPKKLIFEFAETTAVSNFASAELLILRLKELGCCLALDDFGVGFSSFYYLKHFPVDYVKIDGSFIRRINKSEDDKVFVKALSGVAHAFGKKTVAEFVENEEVLAVLKEYEIDYAQGYFIGRPERLV